MRVKLRTVAMIIISVILCAAPKTEAKAALADWQLPADISPVQIELPEISLFADFYFLNEKMEFENKPLIITGRIYLPLNETVEKMGGQVKVDISGFNIKLQTGDFYISRENDDRYPKRTVDYNGVTYVSMIKLLAGSGYEPVFDTKQNKVEILRSQRSMSYSTAASGAKPNAYLRFEDIMADGMDNGFYDDLGLEKMRALSDYLYKNGQKFYVAWIPLYKNPSTGAENNLTTNYNLYNASFLYSLDYLVYRGGKIGLHGYTHQYLDDKSSEGYEFGKNTPFSDIECVNRMLEAKKIARDLGYDVYFFEFPHYAATDDQKRYAEKYFDVIYQQDKNVLTPGYVASWKRANGKIIKYVPTPADYVYTEYDREGILKRIDNCKKKGQVVSLFYHPRVDFGNIGVMTKDDVRICVTKEDTILHSIVEKTVSHGLVFGYF